MVSPSTVHEYGNQLKIVMDDATSFMAYPTTGGLWLVSSVSGGGVAPSGNRFVWPFDSRPTADGGTVTSEFGPRDPYPYHNGIDFATGTNSPIGVMGAGTVTIAQTWDGSTTDPSSQQSLGNFVRVSHGGDLYTDYAHMRDAPLVSVNDVIEQSKIIGYIGETGYSFGLHLHMATWEAGTRINPRDWMVSYATT